MPNHKLSKHLYHVKNAVDSSVAHGVAHKTYRKNICDDCENTQQNFFFLAQQLIPVIPSQTSRREGVGWGVERRLYMI